VLFAHDTEVALAAAAALVNTAKDEPDQLGDVAAVNRFVTDWQHTGRLAGDAADLAAVRELRPRLERLWDAAEDEAAELVNALLREAGALPQLVRHDNWGYHVHATPTQARLADRLAVEAAMAFTDLIRSQQLGRLRRCAAADCGHVLVDLSKNQSRRFCGTSCANRTNVAAYRARRSAAPDGQRNAGRAADA
jgi:predicted RNA-binding Zn ribbon-like protein